MNLRTDPRRALAGVVALVVLTPAAALAEVGALAYSPSPTTTSPSLST